ncbi:hypothetical protein [Novosphingobium acidiphilum]|jgi:hypothetical protein|uniref:hypothetical protein n=1 Tax=Novosphingobium acidiphilum TaxID=505248 RepID=UPI0003FF8BCA|nr:hypothetical protein [Novosphingobium acidiphilum]
MTRIDDKAWFAPKTFGYGAGLPIAWQGWAMLAVMLGVTFGLYAWLMPAHPGYFSASVIGMTVLAMPLMAYKTRGGWRWRSGRD